MNRSISFHIESGSQAMLPAHYLEADYALAAARIYAEIPPSVEDAEFDIYADGVSIFNNRTPTPTPAPGREAILTTTTTIALTKGNNSAEFTADFLNENLDEGTWLTAKLIKGGGGRNFTVQLDLIRISEPDQDEG
jgi:hypothetical protein